MSNIRGRGRGRGGVSTAQPSHSSVAQQSDDDFDEQTEQLRSKYSRQLATVRELFLDWSAEDLLAAIAEANGDVETAVLRISDGKAARSRSRGPNELVSRSL